ncbi:MAG: hypothetical protein CMF50_09530 [Legionellales bacterium]|nr:hypothetical protein [Legionellales bacterium]|tara:strand:- start:10434 stop:11573 length:1140 start_codon:yes stop_codon:yes gene_type:complete
MALTSLRLLLVLGDEPKERIFKNHLKALGFDTDAGSVPALDDTHLARYRPDVVFISLERLQQDKSLATYQETFRQDLVIILVIEDFAEYTQSQVLVDDVVTLDSSKALLKTKLAHYQRMQAQVIGHEIELRNYKELIYTEQNIAKRLFASITRSGSLNVPNIRYILSPMSVFNGDVLLVAEKPSGGLHIILGDFTGHGLPAAIGSLPVADAFYTMTEKSFSIKEIVSEINRKLHQILPANIFCAAAMLDYCPDEQIIKVWNGGLPHGILRREGEGIIDFLNSQHLPLGVLPTKEFRSDVQVLNIKQGDRVYLFSDGIIEAENEAEEMFGEQRLLNVFKSPQKNKSVFDTIPATLAEFTGHKGQGDDITLFELTIPSIKS